MLPANAYLSLFPAVFMIHELEELIMLKPWLVSNKTILEQRLMKRRLYKVIQLHTKISESARALIIAEEFLMVSTITLLSINTRSYNLWLGLVLAFQIHLFIHILQFIILRVYIPALITSLLCSIYTFIILSDCRDCFQFETAAVYTFLFLCALVINLAGCFKMAIAFDQWLIKYSSDNDGK